METHDDVYARRAAGEREFFFRPLRQAPRLVPRRISKDAPLGRSHRAKAGKAKLKQAIDLTREVLQVPADYRIGIVPGSDTGAVEMALWSMLGARGVELLAWESFGEDWVTDVVKQLKLEDARVLKAALRRRCPISPRSTSTTTWSSPGTAPPPACACRTPTGSPPTARA